MHPRTRTLARTGILVLTLGLLLSTLAGTASAERSCTGTIGPEQVDDTIQVPDGASCTLDGTIVDGNVMVGTGATLTSSAARVGGNIQAEGAARVTVTGGSVGGSVQLVQGATAAVTSVAVTGDIQLESNTQALSVDGNDVGGNVQVEQNTGGADIRDNTIDGNLQCQANQPAPTGGRNLVHGSAEDQCADLTGTPDPGGPGEPAPGRDRDRIAGPNRFATAVAISQRVYPDGASVVYLARADEFADALAAKSLQDGPVLLVPSCGALPPEVAAEIGRLDPGRVVALGGTNAICDAMLDAAAGA